MTQTIWKFPVSVGDWCEFAMPAGATVLSVQVQGDQPQLWALCDPDAAPEPRRFQVIGTGHLIDDPVGRFVGTFQLADGAFIGHLFEAA